MGRLPGALRQNLGTGLGHVSSSMSQSAGATLHSLMSCFLFSCDAQRESATKTKLRRKIIRGNKKTFDLALSHLETNRRRCSAIWPFVFRGVWNGKLVASAEYRVRAGDFWPAHVRQHLVGAESHEISHDLGRALNEKRSSRRVTKRP